MLSTPLLLLFLVFTACVKPQPQLESPPQQQAQAHDEKKYESAKKEYKTVQIGDLIWMAENLNENVEGSKCYEDKPENCEKYGRLYNWETALKVCPDGWHLPSDAEWDDLLCVVACDGIKKYKLHIQETAGVKLKAKSGWNLNHRNGGSGNGTDDFGFVALPGGFVNPDGNFDGIGTVGLWWTSTATNDLSHVCFLDKEHTALTRYIYNTDDRLNALFFEKDLLLSVRCVKD